MTELRFRNIVTTPQQPVAEWGFEGLLAAIDRGSIRDWNRIARELESDPWGGVAELLEDEVFGAAEDVGVVAALRQVLDDVRAEANHREKREVADELRTLVKRSGLSQDAFARRLGTSRPRLNSYLNAKVTPSATILIRARTAAQKARAQS